MNYWQEVEITIHREAEEAVGELLLNMGAQGIAIDDSLLVEEGLTQGWGDYFPAVACSDMIKVKAYFFTHKSDAQLEELTIRSRQLAEFGLTVGTVAVSAQLICEQDWANAWKAYYHTEQIGRVVIKPSWEDYDPKSSDIVVSLDPGMAFGTGTHPSTAMCIKQLQELDVTGKEIWDIGTGSGILAIVATKLGGEKVTAVDVDPIAIQVSKENARVNQVDIPIFLGSLEDIAGHADVILVNIIADVIIKLLPHATLKLRSNGKLITSGIISQRATDVKAAAKKYGWAIHHEMHEGEWVSFCFAREELNS